MQIGQIRIWPNNNHPKIAANGLVTLDEVMNVKFTLFKSSNDLFVGFPGKYGEKVNPDTGKKPWYSDVQITDESFRTELTAAILEAYHSKISNDNLNQGEAPGATNQDQCPF